jgi:hypothetical protein
LKVDRLHRILLGNEEVSYLLRRSPRRRTVGLRVDPSGLTVSVPSRTPQRAWEAILREKSGWVLGKLEAMRACSVPAVNWRDGEWLPFLGSPIELVVEQGTPRARPILGEGQLRVALPDPSDTSALESRIVQWYRREALAFFQHRVEVYARQLGVRVARLGLSSARTRWGSCTSGGNIRLNWRLIKAPPSVIDYVVAHELAHLVELNHSPSFWQIVARLCPDYAMQRALLKEQAAHYHRF